MYNQIFGKIYMGQGGGGGGGVLLGPSCPRSGSCFFFYYFAKYFFPFPLVLTTLGIPLPALHSPTYLP